MANTGNANAQTEGQPPMKFESRLEPMGPRGAWTCIAIPFNVHEAFGTRARVPVKGTVNGFPFRSSVFPTGGGAHFMMVNKEMQRGAGVQSGDLVSVSIEKDAAPRTVDVPQDLASPLSEHLEARERFQKIPYSHRKEYVDWITSAKRSETRARRIEKALDMLAEGLRLKG